MKNTNVLFRLLLLLAFCGLSGVNAVNAEVNPKPFVVPELKDWSGMEGSFAPSGRVVAQGGRLAVQAAELFAADYEALTGRKLTVSKGKTKRGDFAFVLKSDQKLGEEGYRLGIGEHVSVQASGARGLKWGASTVLQLTEQDTSGQGVLPRGMAEDVPEYALRGFMMDCGRKFIPMAYLESLVKMMAYYKMNTLQIHLNDNGFRQFFGNDWSKTQAAFRLECDTYPGLTAKDGAYTKAEFVALQQLAEQYGVEIIPEIDVPAHSLAFTHYRPEIGSKEYGMDHLDLFNPATYEFVDGLFREYLEGEEPVFRGKRVHIGTDEYSNARQDVVEKFREFTDHYIKYVEKYGKQAMVWGALTHAKGQTPVKADNVVMGCWYNGFADPKAMKELGYQLVSIPDGLVYIVPAAGYYYDYLNCQYLYDNWTPATIGNARFDEGDPAVLGGMFAVWNDHVGNGITVKDIHDRLFPALQTLSVKCWTGQHVRLPYADFDENRKLLSDAPGVDESARMDKGEGLVVDNVNPGDRLPREEVGYDYTVTFTVDAVKEEKGTELFRSQNAVFYLSDPREGKLGFLREGYLNTFNYRLPEKGQVVLTVQGNNRMTRLLVNGKPVETLDPKPVYVMKEKDILRAQYGENTPWSPVVYSPAEKMNYHRTLFFPLRQAGRFKSRVYGLTVKGGI